MNQNPITLLRQLAFIIMVYIATAINSSAFGQSEIRITNGEWAPYLSEGLPHYGPVSQLVTEAFAKSGIKVIYGFFPWSRSYEEARSGNWDATILWTQNKERKQDFLYSNPVLKLNDVFFHLKSKQFDWNSIEDLKGLKVGMSQGYYYGKLLEKAENEGIVTVDRAPNDLLNLRKLLRHRINVFTANEGVGYKLIEQNFSTNIHQVTHHPKPVRIVDYYLLLSKKVKNSKALISAFNNGLDQLEKEGRIQQLLTGDDTDN